MQGYQITCPYCGEKHIVSFYPDTNPMLFADEQIQKLHINDQTLQCSKCSNVFNHIPRVFEDEHPYAVRCAYCGNKLDKIPNKDIIRLELAFKDNKDSTFNEYYCSLRCVGHAIAQLSPDFVIINLET